MERIDNHRTHTNYIRRKCYYCQSTRVLAQSVGEIYENERGKIEILNWFFGTEIPNEGQICDPCSTFIDTKLCKTTRNKRGKPKTKTQMIAFAGYRKIERKQNFNFPVPNYGANWLVSQNCEIMSNISLSNSNWTISENHVKIGC